MFCHREADDEAVTDDREQNGETDEFPEALPSQGLGQHPNAENLEKISVEQVDEAACNSNHSFAE